MVLPSFHLSIDPYYSVAIYFLVLPHFLTYSGFSVSQGDDGEIGPRGLPGESVSDHIHLYVEMYTGANRAEV